MFFFFFFQQAFWFSDLSCCVSSVHCFAGLGFSVSYATINNYRIDMQVLSATVKGAVT